MQQTSTSGKTRDNSILVWAGGDWVWRIYANGKIIQEWPATDEEIKAAMHLVPDDVVQMCTASGSPEEVKQKVREYVDHGCTCPILYPLGDPRLMIDIFADGYN